MSQCMGVGIWDPGAGKESVSQALLDRLVVAATDLGDDLGDDGLREAGVAADNWVMSLPEPAWALAEALPTADLVHLIRFFTLAEARVPGWDAGKKSPVIALVKMLKRRQAFTPELRRWIKAHTDNRYLPYGSALQG